MDLKSKKPKTKWDAYKEYEDARAKIIFEIAYSDEDLQTKVEQLEMLSNTMPNDTRESIREKRLEKLADVGIKIIEVTIPVVISSVVAIGITTYGYKFEQEGVIPTSFYLRKSLNDFKIKTK